MRYIGSKLKARLEKARQTLYDNANPGMSIWISRYNTALQNSIFLERAKVGDYSSIGQLSITARRPNISRQADRIYAAVCDNGVGRIMYADQKPTIASHTWISAGTIDNAIDIAICFDGKMVKSIKNKVEFKTTDLVPWVFWVDASGILYGKLLGDEASQVTLATANVSVVTAVRGMQSDVADFDQGLLVFFILSGAIYYRTYRSGTWEDAAPINFGPDVTWVDITASRTWDYRIVLQAKDSNGDIYELFTQYEGIAKQNVERVEITNIKAAGEQIDVTYHDTTDDERIEIFDISAAGSVIYGLSPVPLKVYNIDDGNNDWGRFIIVEFDYPVYGIAESASCFVLTDSNEVSYTAQAIEYIQDGTNTKILLWLLDFNGAYQTECTLVYTPGVIQGPAVPLEAFSFEFMPENLIIKEPGKPTSASNSSDTVITVEFNRPLTCADYTVLAAALSVTGQEYNYVPGGILQAKTYAISSATLSDTKKMQITLTGAGRMRAPQGDVTVAYSASIGNLVSDTGAVLSFSQAFAPTGLTPVYNPNDPERIEISNISATGNLITVTYKSAYSSNERIEITDITATGTLTHINDL